MKFIGYLFMAGIIGVVGLLVIGSVSQPKYDRTARNKNAAAAVISWCSHRASGDAFADCVDAASAKYLAGVNEGRW